MEKWVKPVLCKCNNHKILINSDKRNLCTMGSKCLSRDPNGGCGAFASDAFLRER